MPRTSLEPSLGLAQGEGDLLLREPFARHGTPAPGATVPDKLRSRRTALQGQDQLHPRPPYPPNRPDSMERVRKCSNGPRLACLVRPAARLGSGSV
jgi:hypothetical protein